MRNVLILLLPALAAAHMAITVPDSTGASHECRSLPTAGDTRRNPNSNNCHDTTFSDYDQFTLTAGSTITATTTFGAGHNGGHSAWALSTDDRTWYKFQDDVDTTLTGGQQHDFTVPSNAMAACSGGCTLAWFWTPVSSGACEVYQNCFNVKIAGATGGLENGAPTFSTNLQNPIISNCQRVDGTTHLTTHFSTFASENPGADSAGPVPNEDVEGNCVTYTVQAGDTLGEIADTYDVDGGYMAIYNANKDVLSSPDNIEPGMELAIPGGDCGSAAPAAGGIGGGTIGGIVVAVALVGLIGAFFATQKKGIFTGNKAPKKQLEIKTRNFTTKHDWKDSDKNMI